MSLTADLPRHRRALPLLVAAVLLPIQLIGIGVFYKHAITFDCYATWHWRVCRGANMSLLGVFCMLVALGLLSALQPAPLRALLTQAGTRIWPLGLNLGGALLALTPALFITRGAQPALPVFAIWGLGMGALLMGMALYLAPLTRWRSYLAETWTSLLPAMLGAAATPWLAVQLRGVWSLDAVADTTFDAVAWSLGALGYDVQSYPAEKAIGAGEFFVQVANSCSGVEGLALVTLFVTMYLWLFRADLRFPQALLLYPLGMMASACFNVVRITVLVIIGIEGNPELAIGGFHSHAGWLMFTLVALGIIALAQTQSWLKTAPAAGPRTPAAEAPARPAPLPFFQDPMVARILPFAVFMATALLSSAFFLQPSVVYPFRALAWALILLPFLGLYRALGWRLDWVAIGAGVAIALMWVLIPVEPAETPPYGALTGGLLLLWLIARGIGTTVLVPVIEELFFRDYLEGLFRRGTGLGWTIAAALISGGLFAVLHGRWAEAFVAALIFSWLVQRPGGRVTDAIIAHGVANGLIFAVALAWGRFEII